MTALAATVLIPTHEHSELLPYAARSALRQTVTDLELLIVGDGVADATREVVARLMAEDGRVRFFDRPKGERNGEAYRDAILREARGEVVCYLSDDDLWLPDHVETMAALLSEADFATALTIRYDSEEELEVLVHDLAMPFYRELLLSGNNRVPLSSGAHTMAVYHRLPHGWRTTPPGIPTDLYMWQQFLSEGSCRAVTAMKPTVLNFPSSSRPDWPPRRRAAELEQWSERLGDPSGRSRLAAELPVTVARAQAREWARLFAEWQSLMADRARRQAEHERLEGELERVRRERQDLVADRGRRQAVQEHLDGERRRLHRELEVERQRRRAGERKLRARERELDEIRRSGSYRAARVAARAVTSLRSLARGKDVRPDPGARKA
jgi:hypothetical protein